MISPEYTVIWTHEKMLDRLEVVIKHWDELHKLQLSERRKLAPASASDPKYLGDGKRLDRQIAEAKKQLLAATIMHKEVLDSKNAAKDEVWPVKSMDLDWFYPELQNIGQSATP